MSVQIQQVWQVKLDACKWVPEVKTVNNMVFAKVCKWSRGWVRFSSGASLCLKKGKSKYANSPVVDRIVELRQAKCNELLLEALRTEDDNNGEGTRKKPRKGRKGPRVCKKSDLLLIDAVIDVRVSDDPEPWDVKMLAEGIGTHMLWIQLNEENMTKLRERTRAALAAGEFGTSYRNNRG